MFFIISTKFITWGAEEMQGMTRCTQCGTVGHFIEKTGRRFIALFFVIPIIPIGGKQKILECPNCKAQYPTV